MADFKKVAVNISVIGVLILAIFSWIIITQTQNNPKNLITNNTIINNTYSDLYGQISSAQSGGDSAVESFGNVTPTQSYGIVDVTSIVSTTKIFRALILGVYNVVIELPVKILGIPPIVAGVLSAILILFIILGTWAIWRGVAT